MGDIEILYIPILQERPDDTDLFATIEANLADDRIQDLERACVLGRRLNSQGRTAYGPKNKLMVHIPSGIPIDLFAATEENWFNYLVCRTGPADSNTRICMAAQRKGWKWSPYSCGFHALNNGQVAKMGSEEEVFNFVGIPYMTPEARK
ncbi:MAG: hypothetical protein IMZ69_01275 [Spirochaetes bacterium]|nr:hypothetical protein [Spirochaetota bacterium]